MTERLICMHLCLWKVFSEEIVCRVCMGNMGNTLDEFGSAFAILLLTGRSRNKTITFIRSSFC